jgi:hypothetical protein
MKDDEIITNEDPVETETTEPIEKYVVPYNYNHKSDIVTFNFYSDEERCQYPVTGHFEIMVKPYGIAFNEERFQRMCDVIDNLVGSTFLSNTSEITPLFCNGTFNNISFEIPTTEMSVPCIISFLYYKCEAVLGNYGSILMFKFVPSYNKSSVYIDIPTHRKLNPYIDEDEWMAEKQEILNDIQNDDSVEFDMSMINEKTFMKPWWHRDDETTRDYYFALENSNEPIHIIMELTEPVENEAAVYPLYTEDSIKRAIDAFEVHKIGDMPIEGKNIGDIVDSNKDRITVEEMMDAITSLENDEDDTYMGSDDEIVVGDGKE